MDPFQARLVYRPCAGPARAVSAGDRKDAGAPKAVPTILPRVAKEFLTMEPDAVDGRPIDKIAERATREEDCPEDRSVDALLRLLASIEIDIVKKLNDTQHGVPTFFDNLVLQVVQTVRSGERLLRQPWDSKNEYNELRQRLIEMKDPISLYFQSKRQPRLLRYIRRLEETRSHATLPWELGDAQFAATQGIDECLQCRGLPLFKTVFDFALYPMIIWGVRPHTIIELGSGLGTSGVWYADLLESFGIPGHIFSVDIRKPEINKPCVTFIQGDCEKIDEVLPLSFLHKLPHPWLVIEDAHVNTAGILIHFRQSMREKDYLIVEDSTSKAPVLAEFMREFDSEFMVDRRYVDFFGRNATCSKDSIFVRI